MAQTTTFEHTAHFLAQSRNASRTGEDFFKCLTLDLGGPYMDEQLFQGWSNVAVDMFFSEFARDEVASVLASLSDLEWYTEDTVELRFMTRAGEKTTVGTSYDLVWMDVAVDLRHPARVAEASLRAAREEAIRILAGRGDRARRHELEQHTILLVTLDGPAYEVPEVIAVGPSERAVDRDSHEETFSINVIYVPLNDDARHQGSQSDFANRLSASLGKLARSGDAWKEAFKESAITLSDARNRFRRRLRDRLEEVMQLLEETRSEACKDEKLGVLREAASILAFRTMFSLELERRKRLYRDGPSEVEFGSATLVRTLSDEMGYVSLDEGERREGASDPGSVLARLVHTVRAVRQEVDDDSIAITGASIFANRPNNHFDDTLPEWLSAMEALVTRDSDSGLLARWDRALKRLGSVMLGHLDDEFREELNLMGNGAARHRHRVLGNVYEQVLAMTPVRGDEGKVTLTFGAQGDDRAALGAHYTPADLVEEVVRPTLGHLFRQYWGAADGNVEAYRRRIRRVTVVDPAMGSAHFLTVTALEIAREIAWLEFFEKPRFELITDWEEPLLHKNSIGEDPEGEDERTREDRFIEAERHHDFEAAVRKELPGVIRRSIYGVDVNPLACELGKLSLWLFEVSELERGGSDVGDAEYPELTYLDANIRCGDSVVGVFLDDVQETVDNALRSENSFDGRQQTMFGLISQTETLEEKLGRARLFRDSLRELPDDLGEYEIANFAATIEQKLDIEVSGVGSGYDLHSRVDHFMRELLKELEWVFNLTLAVRYAGYTSNSGTAKITEMYRLLWAEEPPHGGTKDDKPAIENALRVLFEEPDGIAARDHRENLAAWLAERKDLDPFHWEIEFPGIIKEGGFDAVVANPPFIGDRDLRGRLGSEDLVELLANYFIPQQKKSDYSGFFFWRYDQIVNGGGVVGSLASNSLAQASNRKYVTKPLTVGDSPHFGIFRAVPNREWPGDANVHFSAIHMARSVSVGQVIVREDPEVAGEQRPFPVAHSHGISSFLDEYPDFDLSTAPSSRDTNLLFTGMFLRGNFAIHRQPAESLPEALSAIPVEEHAALAAYLNSYAIQQFPRPTPQAVVVDFFEPLRAAELDLAKPEEQLEWLESEYPTLIEYLRSRSPHAPDDECVYEQRIALGDSDSDRPHKERWWLFDLSDTGYVILGPLAKGLWSFLV